MDAETLEKYKMARDVAWPIIDKISSLAQMVATATKAPNAQSEIDVDAIGLISEMIVEDVQKIDEIFNRHLGNPYKLEKGDGT